jgi:hypothetical protein
LRNKFWSLVIFNIILLGIFPKILFCVLNLIKKHELVAKINAEFEAFTAETESLIDKGVKAAERARKSTLNGKIIKGVLKLSIEESKKYLLKKSP